MKHGTTPIMLPLDKHLMSDLHAVAEAQGTRLETVVAAYLVEWLHDSQQRIDYTVNAECLRQYRLGQITSGTVMERLDIDNLQMLDHLMQAYGFGDTPTDQPENPSFNALLGSKGFKGA